MILELLQTDGFEPKQKGHKDEWASPCPACGGHDRFIIHTDNDRYWCRQCNAKGDTIQYLRDFHGLSFREAEEAVGRGSFLHGTPRPRKQVKTKQPPPTTINRASWNMEAAKIISFAKEELNQRPEVLEWLRGKRGINRETAARFNLGWLPCNLYLDRTTWGLPEELKENGTAKKLFIPSGLLIPGPDRLRVRREYPGELGKYYVVPGSNPVPYEIGQVHERTAIVVESELDAFILAQKSNREIFIVALGSTNVSEEHRASLSKKLNDSPVVLVSFDSDAAGAKAAGWWLKSLHNAFRTPIPPKYGKDFTEAHVNGLDLNEWVSACLELYCETILGANTQ